MYLHNYTTARLEQLSTDCIVEAIHMYILILVLIFIFIFELSEAKDGINQKGTVNLHFLIPGTNEPVSAMVSL